MSESKYVENSSFELPIIKNGVQSLGDLWDCRSSSSLNLNLFSKNLEENYLRVTSIRSKNYNLHHLKTTNDKLQTVHVDGEISLELLAGLINIKGSANFDDKQKSEKFFEKATCRYEEDNFSIELLPSAKEILDELVIKKILKNEIKPTHVVKKVVVGANIDASVQVSYNTSEKTQNITGNFFGKMIFGPVNAAVKIGLQFLDTEKSSNIETSISVESKPPLKSPKTIVELFEMIDSIESVMKKEKHFKQIKEHEVIGVPIRFYLVPISDFLDFQIEALYVKLADEALARFTQMLTDIQDFSETNCIRVRVFEEYGPSGIIILNNNSIISKNIVCFEKKLNKITNSNFPKAVEIFKKYKIHKANETDLLKVIENFRAEFNKSDVLEKINEFINECRKELSGAHIGIDSKDHEDDFILFTDELSSNEWFNPEKIPKILLKTNGESPKDVFLELYKLTADLKKIGFSIGVTVPSVGKEFSLTIKIRDHIVVYRNKEIQFVIKVLKIGLGKSTDNEVMFSKIYGELTDVDTMLTKDNIDEVNILISLLKQTQNIKISKSHNETQFVLRKRDDKWRFFISLDAVDSASEAIKKMKLIINSKTIFKNFEWFVGNLNLLSNNTAPLIFLVRNSKIHLVLTDYLDILIMMSVFKNVKLTDDFDFKSNFHGLLSIKSLNHVFCLEKAEYCAKLENKLNENEIEINFKENFPFKTSEVHSKLDESLKVYRCFVRKNNKIELFKCFSKISTKYHNNLNLILDDAGFHEFEISSSNNKDWNSLINKLNQFKIDKKGNVYGKFQATYDIVNNAILNGFQKEDLDFAFFAIENLISQSEVIFTSIFSCGFYSDTFLENKLKDIFKDLEDFIKIESKENKKKILKETLYSLKKYLDGCKQSEEDIHIDALIEVCKINKEDKNLESEEILKKFQKISKQYLDRIPIKENYTQKLKEKIEEFSEKNYFFRILELLNNCLYNVNFNTMNKQFEKLSIQNIQEWELCDLIGKISSFNSNEKKYLWKNKRFTYLIEKNMNENIFKKIVNSKFEKLTLPKFLAEKIPLTKELKCNVNYHVCKSRKLISSLINPNPNSMICSISVSNKSQKIIITDHILLHIFDIEGNFLDSVNPKGCLNAPGLVYIVEKNDIEEIYIDSKNDSSICVFDSEFNLKKKMSYGDGKISDMVIDTDSQSSNILYTSYTDENEIKLWDMGESESIFVNFVNKIDIYKPWYLKFKAEYLYVISIEFLFVLEKKKFEIMHKIYLKHSWEPFGSFIDSKMSINIIGQKQGSQVVDLLIIDKNKDIHNKEIQLISGITQIKHSIFFKNKIFICGNLGFGNNFQIGIFEFKVEE